MDIDCDLKRSRFIGHRKDDNFGIGKQKRSKRTRNTEVDGTEHSERGECK